MRVFWSVGREDQSADFRAKLIDPLDCAGLVEPEFFQQSFIGDLLHLEHDPVPNVRMALARMLAAADLTTLPSAVLVLQRLSQDPDMCALLCGS